MCGAAVQCNAYGESEDATHRIRSEKTFNLGIIIYGRLHLVSALSCKYIVTKYGLVRLTGFD